MKTYPVAQPFSQVILQTALASAGVNVITINGNNTNPSTGFSTSGQVVTDDNAVDATVNAIIAATPGVPQVPRSPQEIANSLFALTAQQKTNIIAALFGGKTDGTTPAGSVILTAPGMGGWAITAGYMDNISPLGATSFNPIAQLLAAACYVHDVPTYLINPAFDPTINVSGTKPAS